MRTPKIHLVAYSEQDWVFVGIPDEPGRYVRTHKCVVYTPCPHCQAAIGEPCFNPHYVPEGQRKKYWSVTHSARRSRYIRPDNHKSYKPKRDKIDLDKEDLQP